MSRATYFISDLHLSPQTEALTELLRRQLKQWESDAEVLYILGDLFEAWAGDEQLQHPYYAEIAALLRASSRHYKVFLLHGNRDFLLGDEFAKAAGLHILPDNTVIDLYGQKVVLAHGDALCTDDVAYQQFRQMVRDPAWQQKFLSLPMEARLQQVADARAQSQQDKQSKSMEIMDVNQAAVDALVRAHDYAILIHGHTHRPAVHEWDLDENACERWVLPDWYDEEGGFMRADAAGWEMETIEP